MCGNSVSRVINPLYKGTERSVLKPLSVQCILCTNHCNSVRQEEYKVQTLLHLAMKFAHKYSIIIGSMLSATQLNFVRSLTCPAVFEG